MTMAPRREALMVRTVVLPVLIAVVGLAGVAGGCGRGDLEAVKEAPGQTGSQEPTAAGGGGAVVDPARDVALGELAETGGWGIRVVTVADAKSAGGATASDGRILVVVEFELTNTAAQPRHIGQVDFRLTDAGSAEYRAVPTIGEEFIFNTPQPIEAGETRNIRIVYDTPSPVPSGLVLRFQPFLQAGAMADPVEVRLD